MKIKHLLIALALALVSIDAQAEKLAAIFPDARVELFPGGGHLFFWEQPDRFVEVVTEFLR